MATRKPAPLEGNLIARKGHAAPAQATTAAASAEAPKTPHGTKDTIAVTVRLDPERYQRLIAYRAQFPRRKTNQEILIAALDAYLAQVKP